MLNTDDSFNDTEFNQNILMNSTIRSPEDSRDWNSESIFDETFNIPLILDLKNNLNKVRNQGSQGTCAAQTAACMKEWQELKDIKFINYMSPQFIYNNRTNQDSSGMFGRDVMRILSKVGSCSEDMYPYNKVEPKENIDPKFYNEAKNYVIKSYARVNTIDSLKRALYLNGPCYISFPVFNYTTRMWRQRNSDKSLGGHAMTVVGYDKDGFIIRNTWGIQWGDNGYCTYPYSDWGCHHEVWTTIDANSTKIPKETFIGNILNKCISFFYSLF